MISLKICQFLYYIENEKKVLLVNKEILFDLLKEREEFNKLYYYIEKAQTKKQLRKVSEQINKKITEIITNS